MGSTLQSSTFEDGILVYPSCEKRSILLKQLAKIPGIWTGLTSSPSACLLAAAIAIAVYDRERETLRLNIIIVVISPPSWKSDEKCLQNGRDERGKFYSETLEKLILACKSVGHLCEQRKLHVYTMYVLLRVIYLYITHKSTYMVDTCNFLHIIYLYRYVYLTMTVPWSVYQYVGHKIIRQKLIVFRLIDIFYVFFSFGLFLLPFCLEKSPFCFYCFFF